MGTRRRGVKAWHVDTKRMVAHVPADAASPDATALACSPVEPVFALATATAPGLPGAPPPRPPAGGHRERVSVQAGVAQACTGVQHWRAHMHRPPLMHRLALQHRPAPRAHFRPIVSQLQSAGWPNARICSTVEREPLGP